MILNTWFILTYSIIFVTINYIILAINLQNKICKKTRAQPAIKKDNHLVALHITFAKGQSSSCIYLYVFNKHIPMPHCKLKFKNIRS